jgi:hypothetical protein
MTIQNQPHAIFSTFARRTKPRHKANLAKELKMPTHNPPTQRTEFLIIFTLNTQQPYFHQLQMQRPKIIKFIFKNEHCSFSLL